MLQQAEPSRPNGRDPCPGDAILQVIHVFSLPVLFGPQEDDTSRMALNLVVAYDVVRHSLFESGDQSAAKRLAGARGAQTGHGLAERVGFEPTIPITRDTRFPGAPVRPLQHLSAKEKPHAILLRGARSGLRLLETGSKRKLAERVGFEPTIPCGIPHFECGAFNRARPSLPAGIIAPYKRASEMQPRRQAAHVSLTARRPLARLAFRCTASRAPARAVGRKRSPCRTPHGHQSPTQTTNGGPFHSSSGWWR